MDKRQLRKNNENLYYDQVSNSVKDQNVDLELEADVWFNHYMQQAKELIKEGKDFSEIQKILEKETSIAWFIIKKLIKKEK